MNTEYTQGPWMAHIDNPLSTIPGHSIKTAAAPKSPVAIVHAHRGSRGPREGVCNANLIATAPELLEALVALSNKYGRIAFAIGSGMNPREADWEEGDKINQRALDAIAKARGEL